MKINNYIKILFIGLFLVLGLAFISIKNYSSLPLPENHLPVNLSTYINYSSTIKFLNSKNVLFFKANWCSTCTVADENLSKNIASIPPDLTIYKVDFEKESTLRSKYGVTTQHTFVQIDNDGHELKKWVGSYTINEIVSELM